MLATELAEVVIVEPDVFRDERGFFMESYSRKAYAEQGLGGEFVQDNHSQSARGVLRGLHYQDSTAPMAKLVRCTRGAVFDVAVDIRFGSPTFGRWVGAELTEENARQLFVPVGFAHGFLTLSERADLQYRCTGYYAPAAEGSITWNDADLAIAWPLDGEPLVSERDRAAESLAEYTRHPRFRFEEARG